MNDTNPTGNAPGGPATTDPMAAATHSAQLALIEAQDPAVLEMQATGKLPVYWWTSEPLARKLFRMCEMLARSGMVPTNFRNEPDNVMVAVQAGMSLGLSALASLQSFAVINGKPTLYGDAPIAMVLAHPSLLSITETKTGTLKGLDLEWTVTIERQLQSGRKRTNTSTFSVEDAKRAGLWGKAGPWTNYPERMLFNRCRAFCVRDAFADVLTGIALAADDTEERVVDVVATVRDTPPPETSVDGTESLAPAVPASERAAQAFPAREATVPLPGTEDEEAPKPKRRTKAEVAAAKEAKAEQDAADQAKKDAAVEQDESDASGTVTLTSSKGQLVIGNLHHKMTELEVNAICYDVVASELHHCNGEGWREIKPDESSVYNAASDHAARQYGKLLTRWCVKQSPQMKQPDAMDWAKDMLKLKTAPKSFAALTLSQLAELFYETSD
jgi:hypothetical protein